VHVNLGGVGRRRDSIIRPIIRLAALPRADVPPRVCSLWSVVMTLIDLLPRDCTERLEKSRVDSAKIA